MALLTPCRRRVRSRVSQFPRRMWSARRESDTRLHGSKFESRADAKLARRKELLAGHDTRGPCDTKVWIQRAKRALDEVVVVGHRLPVENIEDVSHKHEPPLPAEPHRIRSVAVEHCREWRARLEALRRREPVTARRQRNLAAILVNRIRRQRGQRLARAHVQSGRQRQSKVK